MEAGLQPGLSFVDESLKPIIDAGAANEPGGPTKAGDSSVSRNSRGAIIRAAGNELAGTGRSRVATHGVAKLSQLTQADCFAGPRRLSRSDWLRVIPFFLLHLACLSVFWVGVSWVAFLTALLVYSGRVFGLTAFYHRYFSHRAFKTSRWFQFVGAVLGNAAAQRGPLWWAAHHRDHHRHSDREGDVHSPHVHGFWWSHMGWFMESGNFSKERTGIKDLAKYPELRFLDRYDFLAPVLLAVGMFGWGMMLERWYPQLGTSGWQMLVWGFLISTIVLYHVTYSINSLAHVFGTQRFFTSDHSRNNLWLALITFGEGWHNNHHHYPSAARQGFYWWELDVTYCILRFLACLGIVWDLRMVPEEVLAEGRVADSVQAGRRHRRRQPSVLPPRRSAVDAES